MLSRASRLAERRMLASLPAMVAGHEGGLFQALESGYIDRDGVGQPTPQEATGNHR